MRAYLSNSRMMFFHCYQNENENTSLLSSSGASGAMNSRAQQYMWKEYALTLR